MRTVIDRHVEWIEKIIILATEFKPWQMAYVKAIKAAMVLHKLVYIINFNVLGQLNGHINIFISAATQATGAKSKSLLYTSV